MFSFNSEHLISSDEYNLSSSETYKSDDSSFSDSLKSKSPKWSTQEDEQLRHLVTLYGTRQWKKIAQNLPGRTAIQCSHRFTKINTTELIKGAWTKEEDQKLINWVSREGPSKWSQAALIIVGRTGKQIRERWFNHLCPSVKTGSWTLEEDEKLFELYQKFGTSWSKIAKYLPGRPENTIKNRFYSTLRKVVADKRKTKTSKTSKREQITKETEEVNNNLYLKLSPKIFLSGQEPKQSPKAQVIKVGRDVVTIVLDETGKNAEAEISPEDLFVSYTESVKDSIVAAEFDKLEQIEKAEDFFAAKSEEAETAENYFSNDLNTNRSSDESVDVFFADFSSSQNSDDQKLDLPRIFDDFVCGQGNWMNFGEDYVFRPENLLDCDDELLFKRRRFVDDELFF